MTPLIKRIKLKRAASTIEYIVLMILVIGALIAFKDHLLQAFFGRWKQAGDVFGQGRQYDPREFSDGGTVECFYEDSRLDRPAWIDRRCFDRYCSCQLPPEHPDYQGSNDPTSPRGVYGCILCLDYCSKTADGVRCNQ